MRPMPGRGATLLLGLAVLVPASTGGCQRRGASAGPDRPVLRVWHVWGGTMAEGFTKAVEAYQASHPQVRIEPVFAANDLSSNQKFFTAVAAKTPPEVIFVDGPQVCPWGEWGALEPLTQRCAEAGVAPGDYFAPCWGQNTWKDEVWALTFCADPNFGFVWNRADFRRAGLDLDRPPQTIAELDALARRLTRSEQGELVSIGLIPWAQYGGANSIFTWGWAFGGSFYDDQKRLITCDDPRIVGALEWMCSYAQQYDVTKVTSLQQGFGTQESNPFYTGKLSMMCLHIGGIAEIERYAPGLEYGVTFIPAPPGGEQHSSWVGGWCMAIPRGAKHQDEAWDFIRWLCHSPEGTAIVGRETGLFPGLKASPYFDEVRGKPYYGAFLRILEECRHQRPVMPVQAFYMRALDRAVDQAVYGTKTPAEALREARIATQRELDLVLAGG